MKVLIYVVTFAAAQLQIKNLRLIGPDYDMLSARIPRQIRHSENATTATTRFSLSYFIIGTSIIGSVAFLIGKKLRASQNRFATT